MPLPNTHMFHPQFEAHHRPVADGQLTAECTVSTATLTLLYSGPCRVQRSGDGSLLPVVGDQSIAASAYMVVVPSTVDGIEADHLVEVTVCAGDPDLVGRQFVVRGVQRGSITWQQTLACDMHDQPAI